MDNELILITIAIMICVIIIILVKMNINDFGRYRNQTALRLELEFLKKKNQLLKEEKRLLEKFLKRMVSITGDLIHYQSQDYIEKTPKNAEVYEDVGTILRNYVIPGEEFSMLKVKELPNNSQAVLDKSLIEKLGEFNVIDLIDLVSYMQGKRYDDCLEKCIETVKSKRKKI